MKKGTFWIFVILSVFGLNAFGARAFADACSWDPTGLICAQGKADEEAGPDTPPKKQAKHRIDNAWIENEVNYICPNSGGNTTVQDNCSDYFNSCRSFAGYQIRNNLNNLKCSHPNDGEWTCIESKYQELLKLNKKTLNGLTPQILMASQCQGSAKNFVCGNGHIEGKEVCDGSALPPGTPADNTCSADCKAVLQPVNSLSVSDPAPDCGNGGILDKGEECEDGNRIDGDGCSSGCNLEPAFINGKMKIGADLMDATPVTWCEDALKGVGGVNDGNEACASAMSDCMGKTSGLFYKAMSEKCQYIKVWKDNAIAPVFYCTVEVSETIAQDLKKLALELAKGALPVCQEAVAPQPEKEEVVTKLPEPVVAGNANPSGANTAITGGSCSMTSFATAPTNLLTEYLGLGLPMVALYASRAFRKRKKN